MANMRIEIPAPCDYEADLAKEENEVVIITAYDNKKREVEKDEK